MIIAIKLIVLLLLCTLLSIVDGKLICTYDGEQCDNKISCCNLKSKCIQMKRSENYICYLKNDTNCIKPGEPCTDNYHCCNNYCRNYNGKWECWIDKCLKPGFPCRNNHDCCNNYCREFNGRMECWKKFNCLTSGNECLVDGDCCGRNCVENKIDKRSRCNGFKNRPGCIKQDQPCKTKKDCCKGICDKYKKCLYF